MKKLLLLATLLVLSCAAWAQTSDIGPRHEMRLGVGLCPLSSFDLSAFQYDRDYTMGGAYVRTQQYIGNIYKTPSINFSYSGRLTRWFEMGFVVSYYSVFANTFTRVGDVRVGHYADHYIHLMPTARFVWLRRDLVRMYSSIGVGLTGALVGCAKPVASEPAERYGYMIPSFDVVGVGISVGRQVFGYAELGLGSRGFLNVGVGCRLFSQKQKRNGETF